MSEFDPKTYFWDCPCGRDRVVGEVCDHCGNNHGVPFKPRCVSFGADPDVNPPESFKRPWDARGWNPDEF